MARLVPVTVGVMMGALTVVAARPAHAAPPAPAPGTFVDALRVTPSQVHAGDAVRVAGRGCRPGQRVDLAVWSPGPQPAGTLVAGMAGLFDATIRLPADVQPGQLWIRASCEGANDRPWVLDATLAVEGRPLEVSLVNMLIGAGAALAVAGAGLAGRRRPSRSRRQRTRPPAAARGRRRAPHAPGRRLERVRRSRSGVRPARARGARRQASD